MIKSFEWQLVFLYVETSSYQKYLSILQQIFFFQAYEVHLRTECLSGVFQFDAENTLKELESREDKSECLLYGLPISVKECIGVKV